MERHANSKRTNSQWNWHNVFVFKLQFVYCNRSTPLPIAKSNFIEWVRHENKVRIDMTLIWPICIFFAFKCRALSFTVHLIWSFLIILFLEAYIGWRLPHLFLDYLFCPDYFALECDCCFISRVCGAIASGARAWLLVLLCFGQCVQEVRSACVGYLIGPSPASANGMLESYCWTCLLNLQSQSAVADL